jgi:hypothetical protein
MDRVRKIQISYIAIGLFFIALPFVITDYYYNYLLFLAIWGIGALLVLNGIIYRTTAKFSKKRTVEFEYKKNLPQILRIAGFIIFVTSLVMILLSEHQMNLFLISCILLFVGLMMGIISNKMVKKRKEIEKKNLSD